MPTDFITPDGAPPPMRFGIFLPPMHPTGQNPTLTMHRDVELIQHLDRLGFDEAWIGEHHSSGFETIASPEVFIGHVAALTTHIKLGTGVSSLPVPPPADPRRPHPHARPPDPGRMMFGVGPGQLASDAAMLGIEVDEQRRMMEESFEVIMALFRGEVVTAKTDWFTIDEGRLQLRPYSNFDIAVAASISPSGPKLAGRHGVGLLSVAATNPAGLREPRRPLEGHGGAGRRGRPHRRPLGLADDGPDAHRRDRGAGARGLPLRARAGHGLPRPRRPDRPRSRPRLRGPGQGDERDRGRRRRHAGHGHRPDPAPHRPVRRLRGLPRVRRRPRRLGRRRCAPTSCSPST